MDTVARGVARRACLYGNSDMPENPSAQLFLVIAKKSKSPTDRCHMI